MYYKDKDGDLYVGDYLNQAHFNRCIGMPNTPITKEQAIKYNSQLHQVIGALEDQIERIKAYQVWINAEAAIETGTESEAESLNNLNKRRSR